VRGCDARREVTPLEPARRMRRDSRSTLIDTRENAAHQVPTGENLGQLVSLALESLSRVVLRRSGFAFGSPFGSRTAIRCHSLM
jgi:hypothetical protein